MFGPGAAFEGRINGLTRFHPSVAINLIVQDVQHLGKPGNIADNLSPVRFQQLAALALVLALVGNWQLELLVDFTRGLFEQLPSYFG